MSPAQKQIIIAWITELRETNKRLTLASQSPTLTPSQLAVLRSLQLPIPAHPTGESLAAKLPAWRLGVHQATYLIDSLIQNTEEAWSAPGAPPRTIADHLALLRSELGLNP